MLNALARGINAVTDCNALWWPVVHWRPLRDGRYSARRALLLSLFIALAATVLALLLLLWQQRPPGVRTAALLFSAIWGLTALFQALMAWAWNRRAQALRRRGEAGHIANATQEVTSMKTIQWDDILDYARSANPAPPRVVEKSDDEWREQLDPEVYRITRQRGTEPPHSSAMCQAVEPGQYACACCGEHLFDADEKFDSGTGWPSFTQPVRADVVAYNSDSGFGMQRIEAVCNCCGAHLGHVFPDGPAPSGLRYCINALSLEKRG
ncbi:MAG: peptide-methionine (R)-S-oxide reductase MsrB [Pseudomonadota bacterium]